FADGLLLIELGTIVLFNPKASEFFALDESEVVGKKVNQFVGQPLGNILELTQEKGREVFRQELSINDNLILEVSVICVGGANLCSGQLIILHDITREKAIERLKTEFVSIAAHQLRTPLSAIKWTLSMLVNGEVGQVSSEQKELLNKTYQSNERMINLVNDLLNTTRIEEGKFLAKLAKHDFTAIVDKIIVLFSEEVKKKGLLFDYQKLSKSSPLVELDTEKIALAIQNILDNSLHYTKVGGIRVTLTFTKQRNEFLLTVSDDGMGIARKEQSRIFSKFFRAQSAIQMETEGSGLGLFIAKNIIEAHGGKIWFESTEGHGTTFSFTLPAIGLAGKNLK
ncbi:MAG: ATP-binding protein, partial [Patescibacteria group bacterium]